jgi:adenine-specific DNA-methyltransferase
MRSGIILDIFAGSGTTAHAIIELNIEDAGNRKFICVQLPQPTDEKSEAFKAGYLNIAEICKERIRLTGDKLIKTSNQDLFKQNGHKLDIGFKAFRLDSSNIHAWDGSVENLDKNLFNAENNIKENRTEEDVLYEILLKYGLDLTVPIVEKKVNTCKVYSIGGGVLFICLSDNITTQIADAIGKWKQELNPATCRALFKDNGFKDDIAKTNSIQILRQYGIEEANSI